MTFFFFGFIFYFKYYADVENCESFRGFGYIYIYRRWVQITPSVTLIKLQFFYTVDS